MREQVVRCSEKTTLNITSAFHVFRYTVKIPVHVFSLSCSEDHDVALGECRNHCAL